MQKKIFYFFSLFEMTCCFPKFYAIECYRSYLFFYFIQYVIGLDWGEKVSFILWSWFTPQSLFVFFLLFLFSNACALISLCYSYHRRKIYLYVSFSFFCKQTIGLTSMKGAWYAQQPALLGSILQSVLVKNNIINYK